MLWYSCFIPRLSFLVSYRTAPSPGIFFICKQVGQKILGAKTEIVNCLLVVCTGKWRFKIVFRNLNCSTATKAALVWVINGSTPDSESLDTVRLFRLFLAFTTNILFEMRLWKTNKIKKPRMPPECQHGVKNKREMNNTVWHFSSMNFCIPWGILANVKISRLSTFSSWLCDLFPSWVGALGQRTSGINHITPRFRPINLTYGTIILNKEINANVCRHSLWEYRILNVSTVHLNGIWHLIWRYLSKPVSGGHLVLSGHDSIPRGLNTGFTVYVVLLTGWRLQLWCSSLWNVYPRTSKSWMPWRTSCACNQRSA